MMQTHSFDRWLRLGYGLILIGAVAAVLTGPSAVGQEQNAGNRAPVLAQAFAPKLMSIDQLIFSFSVEPDTDKPLGRKVLEMQLAVRLRELEQACGLTAGQKQKLTLAAQGDIKQFLERVQQVHAKFQPDLTPDKPVPMEKVQDVLKEIQPLLPIARTGIFGPDSLFRKLLPKVLTAEQAARYQQLHDERRAFRFRASILMALNELDAVAPLREAQRERLLDLLQQEIKPPREFGWHDYEMVACQMAAMPEAKLKPLFDDMQWRHLTQLFTSVRPMEAALKDVGEWPEETPAGSASKQD